MAAAPTTTQRGLGWAHQVARRRLLLAAYGQPCPICGRVMRPDQALDLDHTIPRVLGGSRGPLRIAHASCNRRSGAVLRNRLARERKTPRRSRDW
jgi:5-methylcytosine-specific restriction endonuclease McrA